MNTRRINNTTRQHQQARRRMFFTQPRRLDELKAPVKAVIQGR